jgi:hypothetical protein
VVKQSFLVYNSWEAEIETKRKRDRERQREI